MVELHAAGSYRAERRQRRVAVAPYGLTTDGTMAARKGRSEEFLEK